MGSGRRSIEGVIQIELMGCDRATTPGHWGETEGSRLSLDASDVEVTVSAAEVTLSGSVESRRARRRAEDLVEQVSGVS